jgi:O-antigen ligase
MKSVTLKSKIESGPVWFILISGALITLYFNPALQDPFNSPKFWILSLAGSWLAGHCFITLKSKRDESSRSLKFFNFLLAGFVISMLVSALFTDNKFSAFFGEAGRRIGFITYLFLAVFMLASSNYFTYLSLRKIYISVFVISIFTLTYGTAQTTGNDFVTWSNPYNSIIGSFGNPNFASAAMAIFAIICFSSTFISEFSKFYRFINLVLTVGLISLVIRSESRQGLVVFLSGVTVFLSIYIYSKNKNLGILSFSITLLSSIFAVLGMLRIGPLQEYLYKTSVTVRGYYWDAAIEMFKSNPIKGVGIERYGVYFKEYRDAQYPLNYGFDITSTNAHNIPLHLLSTGGFFVGLFYSLLLFFIIFQGIRSLTKLSGQQRYLFAGIFAAWLGFQAQSVISIENVGLGIWNWIFGGVIIAVSKYADTQDGEKEFHHSKQVVRGNQVILLQPVISGVLALCSIILISNLYSGEVNTYKSRSLYNATQKSQSQEFYIQAEKAVTNRFNDPYYKLIVLEMLLQSDNHDRALIYLKSLHLSDPVNLDYLRALAITSEKDGNLNEAIKYRKLIEPIDPWNLDNYLRLGYLYKGLGDEINMKKMLEKIRLAAPDHIIAITATQQLSFG